MSRAAATGHSSDAASAQRTVRPAGVVLAGSLYMHPLLAPWVGSTVTVRPLIHRNQPALQVLGSDGSEICLALPAWPPEPPQPNLRPRRRPR